MIQQISSSENNYNNIKQNIILSSLGGLALGGKETYNTFYKIKRSKDSYVNLMKGFYIKNEKTLEKDLKMKNIQEIEIQERISYYSKLRKECIQKFKSNYRNEVRKIKKFAPLKISIKTLSGAIIGLGTSILISYIKNRTKN